MFFMPPAEIQQAPSQDILFAEGSAKGTDLEAKHHAVANAIVYLTMQLRTIVTSQLDDTVSTAAKKQDVQQQTQLRVPTVQLLGLKVLGYDVRGGTTYVKVSLDRQESLARLHRESLNLLNYWSQLLEEFRAIKNAQGRCLILDTIDRLEKRLQILSNSASVLGDPTGGELLVRVSKLRVLTESFKPRLNLGCWYWAGAEALKQIPQLTDPSKPRWILKCQKVKDSAGEPIDAPNGDLRLKNHFRQIQRQVQFTIVDLNTSKVIMEWGMILTFAKNVVKFSLPEQEPDYVNAMVRALRLKLYELASPDPVKLPEFK